VTSEFCFVNKKGAPEAWPRPLAPLADTHGHLTSFHRHTAEVALARAALAGVRLLAVPVDPTDDVQDAGAFLSWLDERVELARAALARLAEAGLEPPAFGGGTDDGTTDVDAPQLLDNVCILAGAHPYGAASLDEAALARLTALLDSPRCVGVGEIGIDVGPYSKLGLDVQEQAFRTQLRIAHERSLPVELHLRDGDDDTVAHDAALRILREEGVPAAGCDLHCFTSGPDVLDPFLELGCHVAFGGALTFPRSDDIRAAALMCPPELLLVETDCPYMTPVPVRGTECEPAMVSLTAAFLADLRAEAGLASERQTYETLWRNARRFLGR